MSDPNEFKFKEGFEKLSAKKQKELLADGSSMEGTKEVQGEELRKNLRNNKSPEKISEIFCGITIDQLTSTQKELFDKLTSLQREELSQKVLINNAQGQIEFLKLKEAIKSTDLAILSQDSAEYFMQEIKKLGNEWRLPKEMENFNDNNRWVLDPIQSTFDAMILQIPGDTDAEKISNFMLLTGMFGGYLTSTFVFRLFTKSKVARGKYSRHEDFILRPVKSL